MTKPKSVFESCPPPLPPCWLGFCISAKTSVTCLLSRNLRALPGPNGGRCHAMLRRHRIEAIAMQRMTPQEPAYCHDRAPQRSVLGNRNGRILRTCRLEPACDWRSSSRMHDWRNHVLMKCKKSADASISRLRQPLCRMLAHRLPSAPTPSSCLGSDSTDSRWPGGADGAPCEGFGTKG